LWIENDTGYYLALLMAFWISGIYASKFVSRLGECQELRQYTTCVYTPLKAEVDGYVWQVAVAKARLQSGMLRKHNVGRSIEQVVVEMGQKDMTLGQWMKTDQKACLDVLQLL
jgi:hypothetical protein